jgi:hypothetical protein
MKGSGETQPLHEDAQAGGAQPLSEHPHARGAQPMAEHAHAHGAQPVLQTWPVSPKPSARLVASVRSNSRPAT